MLKDGDPDEVGSDYINACYISVSKLIMLLLICLLLLVTVSGLFIQDNELSMRYCRYVCVRVRDVV